MLRLLTLPSRRETKSAEKIATHSTSGRNGMVWSSCETSLYFCALTKAAAIRPEMLGEKGSYG